MSAKAADASDGSLRRIRPGELAMRLASAFGLRGIDVDVALAVLAAHIDHEFGLLLHTVAGRSELGLLAALLPRLEDRLACFDAVGNEAPVVQARLVRRTELDGVGVLTPTRRFRTAVFGQHLLSSLPAFAERIGSSPAAMPWVMPPAGLMSAMQGETSAMCVVSGGPGCGKTGWACQAAHSLTGAALRIDVARAARSDSSVVVEIRELIEDAALVGWPVVLDNTGALLKAESRLSLLLEEILDSSLAKLFVVLGDGETLDERVESRALAHVRVQPPPASVRRELWAAVRPSVDIPTTLADDLVLTPRQIRNAVAMVNAGADPVLAAFEQLPRSQNLALPDRAIAKLDALILPADVRDEIIELIDAIKARGAVAEHFASSRGRAITALFNGDSGTGKTFSCEVIAAEVGLPLMRVNVASLVDKYIGETEKNLVRVFEQAQAQGGILFFDEADALFGNRTDVSRAQDRYANLETNLLLQLMEQFTGVVLLTTNLKQNIDQAFMRRIMFKVYFDPPEAPERARLWRSVLPPDRFEPGVDFARLARSFELSGGSIKAAALRAAYRAMAAGRRVSIEDLVDCAQLEVQGMGRVATW
jgi:MoxR-like ATPase